MGASASVFRDRLETVKKGIAEIQRTIPTLKTEKERALLSDNKRDVDTVNTCLIALQKKLEENLITKDALEKKLSEYKSNEAKAKQSREKVKTRHEKGRSLVGSVIIPAQQAVGPAVLEIEIINTEIRAEAKKYLELVGEEMNPPPPIDIGPALRFAGPGAAGVQAPVEAIKMPEAWTYMSETDRAVEHDKQLKDKLQAHEKRLKIAEEHAPDCPNCLRADVQTRLIVDRKSGHTDAPGQAGRGNTSHHWNLKCPKCGTYVTAAIPETKM